jgi:hypothetical protein
LLGCASDHDNHKCEGRIGVCRRARAAQCAIVSRQKLGVVAVRTIAVWSVQLNEECRNSWNEERSASNDTEAPANVSRENLRSCCAGSRGLIRAIHLIRVIRLVYLVHLVHDGAAESASRCVGM